MYPSFKVAHHSGVGCGNRVLYIFVSVHEEKQQYKEKAPHGKNRVKQTGTNDTLKGTFVKEQSLVACQKVFGRALVQFLADRCNSLNVHTIDEKVSIPEMVVCEYNEDGTKLLDYVIKDADGNDENGIDANHHEKECAPVPKDSEKITETLKDYEDKVKSVK